MTAEAARPYGEAPNVNSYKRATLENTYHVITTLVVPIILVVAAGLALHFGLHPTIGTAIPITSNSSMSVPLIICCSVGAVSAIFLLVEVFLAKRVKKAWEKAIGTIVNFNGGLRETIRGSLQPGANPKRTEVPEGSVKVNFTTTDETKLVGYWRKHVAQNAPTVIIFHGNSMNAQDMDDFGRFYYEKGFNVLLAEYRGYNDDAEGTTATKNAAVEAEYDAKAALAFVKEQTGNQDSSKVLVHGYSLGGAYAATLASYGVHLVLSHTFTTYPEVMRNAIPIPITTGITKELVAGGYGNETNDWNSLDKVKGMSGGLFVIRGAEDRLMTSSFGDRFIETKYGKGTAEKDSHLVTVAGSHGEGSNFLGDTVAQTKFQAYLKEIGMIF